MLWAHVMGKSVSLIHLTGQNEMLQIVFIKFNKYLVFYTAKYCRFI